MNTRISIFVIIIAAMAWACSSKPKEPTAEEIAAREDSIRNADMEASASRKAKLREQRDMKAEERRAAIAQKASATPTFKDASGKVVYYKVEVEPSYAGGEEAMMQYLRENLKYPESAQTAGIEGTVFVDFIIDNKGKVRDINATEFAGEGVDQSLKDEAVRVVTAMPTWVAGTQGGKPVDVAYSIPITFELEN